MADGTLDDALLVLTSGRFGMPEIDVCDLPGGILGADHHDVASVPSYLRPGIVCSAKLQYGRAEFVYLQYYDQDTPVAMAAQQIAVNSSATVWYRFTNHKGLATADTDGCALGVVCLSAMTDTQYGWFQCGGPVATELVADLDGDFATDGTVAIGPVATASLTADAIGLTVPAADAEAPIGQSLAANS